MTTWMHLKKEKFENERDIFSKINIYSDCHVLQTIQTTHGTAVLSATRPRARGAQKDVSTRMRRVEV